MSNIWKLKEISIFYPSFNFSNDRLENIYALNYIRLLNNNYRLDISFEDDYYSSLYKINTDNSITPIDNIKLDDTNKLLNNYNLSILNDIDKLYVNFFVLENDEDGNRDYRENINIIESGDYGLPIKYKCNLSLNNYYELNVEEQNILETVLLEDIIKIVLDKINNH